MNLQPSATQQRILIAEDEFPMRNALADTLMSEGYRVILAEDGEAALGKAEKEQPDLFLLDVMMPKIDGFSLCAALRRIGLKTPILLLTAKGQIADRVTGLDAGADDYLTKPFSTDELLARVRALLRRTGNGETDNPVLELQLGSVQIDFARQEATRESDAIHLAPKEFAMLRLMADARGQAVSRERFLDSVWGYSAFPTTRTVDNHIAKLRAKLEPDPDNPQFIITLQGVGYRLELPS